MTTLRTRIAALATVGALAGVGLVCATAADASQATPAKPARCGDASLAVTATFSQGGAGHSWMALIYRNASKHTCTVRGYPGLDAITKTGHVLSHATRTASGYGSGGKLGTVTIRPGGYASAGVEWLNFNGSTGGSCRFSHAITTIVAGTSRVHTLPVSVSACELTVHPTVAGTPQYPDFGPAQHDWIVGSRAISAETHIYLSRAERALKKAHAYPEQVKELAQLIALPETGLTKKQLKQAHADVTALDSFFVTPHLYF